MRPLEKEEKVRKILEIKFKTKLIKRQLLIGTRSDGSPIFHEFDIVSVNKDFKFDGRIVGEAKSYKFGNENGYRTTRFCRMVTACMYLKKVKVKKRLLILTNKELCDRFKRDVDGLISKDIEIVFIPVDSKNNLGDGSRCNPRPVPSVKISIFKKSVPLRNGSNIVKSLDKRRLQGV